MYLNELEVAIYKQIDHMGNLGQPEAAHTLSHLFDEYTKGYNLLSIDQLMDISRTLEKGETNKQEDNEND